MSVSASIIRDFNDSTEPNPSIIQLFDFIILLCCLEDLTLCLVVTFDSSSNDIHPCTHALSVQFVLQNVLTLINFDVCNLILTRLTIHHISGSSRLRIYSCMDMILHTAEGLYNY